MWTPQGHDLRWGPLEGGTVFHSVGRSGFISESCWERSLRGPRPSALTSDPSIWLVLLSVPELCCSSSSLLLSGPCHQPSVSCLGLCSCLPTQSDQELDFCSVFRLHWKLGLCLLPSQSAPLQAKLPGCPSIPVSCSSSRQLHSSLAEAKSRGLSQAGPRSRSPWVRNLGSLPGSESKHWPSFGQRTPQPC